MGKTAKIILAIVFSVLAIAMVCFGRELNRCIEEDTCEQ